MRSLLPCPRGFFGVLRRDFAFCGTEKRGVRFFTHASRRKNLKREAARGGWIFTPCPRLALPYFRPVARGTFAASGAVFGFAVAVGAVRSGAVRRLAARSRFRFRTRPPFRFPAFFRTLPRSMFRGCRSPRALSGRAFHGQRFFGLLPIDSDVVGYFTSSCGFGYRRRRWLNK